MNHQRTFHKQLLRSQRGSVLLMSVIAGIVISIMFFASIAYIESQANMMARVSTKSDRRIVMDGLFAYTVNAVKQSWCLSDTWAEDLTCSLNHPRNTERLLLSDEALLFIRNSGTPAPSPVTAARLTSFSAKVTLDSLTESHPLYSILTPVKNDYAYVQFTIERDSSAISAVRGREVPIKITVFLSHKSKRELDETLVSRNIVYPRELSYFGLILANDLNLATGSSDASLGNVRLENINVPSTGGLRFESPVFVNGDLNMPPSSLTGQMNNITFVDKIVLGGGVVKRDNNKFIVKSAGGPNDMYNYSMANFAGIMGGFERDPGRDTGLDYLFKLSGKGELSYDAQQLCRDRIMGSYTLSLTDDAQLWVKPNAWSNNAANISLNLGNIDNFVEQDVNGYKTVTTVPGVTAGAETSGAVGMPVIKAKVFYNGLVAPTGAVGAYSTEFYIHRTGTVTLYPTGAGQPTITITSSPQTAGGHTQYNQVNLNINLNSLNLTPYISDPATNYRTAPSVKFTFEAYDYGYSYGNNLRDPSALFRTKTNGVTFTEENGVLVLNSIGGTGISAAWRTNSGLSSIASYPAYETDTTYTKRNFPNENYDWAAFDDNCFKTPDPTDTNADFSAFPAATWDTSFAPQARNSWSFDTEFANRPKPGYYELTKMYDSPTDTTFRIDSLVKSCVVGPNQKLLAGMFACESFTIAARSTPLRIIGTVITNQLFVDPSAYRNGIRWSSIYHPQAVQELIQVGILGKDKAGAPVSCNTTTLAPLWQSNIGVRDRYAHWVCNPVSLRTADPFKWSTVDPDCGLSQHGASTPAQVAASTSVKCKKRTTRFLIKEISRGKGL